MRLWIAAAWLGLGVTMASAGESRLHVEGNQIKFGNEEVRLLGVAVGDVFLARESRPLSDYEWLARDWKANVVRMGIHPSVWKTEPHAKVIARLRENVEAASRVGIFSIIDWHVIGWPDSYFEVRHDSPRDLYDSSFALAKDFWNEVSKAFAHDGRVAFELWNEPVGKVEAAGHGDSKVAREDWKSFQPYLQELATLIRRNGASNLILATGTGWAHNLRGIRQHPLADNNTAYAWHVYGGHDENRSKLWLEALDDVDRVYPVVVTEWGFERGSKEHFKGTPENFGTHFVKLMEEKGLHSTAWCWHNTWTPSMFEADFKTPNEFGRFVKDYLISRRTSP